MGTASPAITATPSFVKPPPGFNDLYQRYSETVYRAALRVTGNAADAEDVLQSVFLRMLDNPDILFRFDVVEVIVADDAKPRLELIKNAFPLSKPYLY